MNRLYSYYIIAIITIVLLVGLGIRFFTTPALNRALSKLGKSESTYKLAREELLLSAKDPCDDLLKLVLNNKKNSVARAQALKILGDISYRRTVPRLNENLGELLQLADSAIQAEILDVYSKGSDFNGIESVAKFLENSADSALTEKARSTMFHMVDFMAQALHNATLDSDKKVIDSLQQISETVQVGKGRLFPILSSYYFAQNDSVRARHYLKRTGLINEWWACGGWENKNMVALDKVYEPETVPFNQNAKFQINDNESSSWVVIKSQSDSGLINLKNSFVKQQYSVAYLLTYVICAKPFDAYVYCGSDDAIKAFVNKKEVWRNESYRTPRTDEDIFKVHFDQGVNELMLKVAQDVGGWGAVARIGDRNGEFPDGISYSLNRDDS